MGWYVATATWGILLSRYHVSSAIPISMLSIFCSTVKHKQEKLTRQVSATTENVCLVNSLTEAVSLSDLLMVISRRLSLKWLKITWKFGRWSTPRKLIGKAIASTEIAKKPTDEWWVGNLLKSFTLLVTYITIDS